MLIIGGILICLVIIVLLIGYLLPVKHTETLRVTVPASPEKVWARIMDTKQYPVWRKDIKSVEAVTDSTWTEVTSDGDNLPLCIVAKEAGKRVVTRINGQGMPFGGEWEYLLVPDSDSTRVTITEHGEVYNPIFRFVSKFIMGHDATMKKYASYLTQSFQ